jgi:hypothetical protein
MLEIVGVSDQAIRATSGQLHDRLAGVLTSSAASSAALITFWATVGLVAYLVCWGVFNLLVEARNELTLTTAYTNHGHWKGPLETLAIKTVGAALLVSSLAAIKPGFTLWLALAAPVFVKPDPLSILAVLGAVLSLAVQLYLIFACALLTITPWYREEAFTESLT